MDTLTIRTYRAEDLRAMVDLINAADAVDQLERGTTLERLQREMTYPRYRPEENCFLAWLVERLVGFSDVYQRPGENGADNLVFSDGVVHPDWRRRGIGRALLERCYARAIERLPEAASGAVYFQDVARDVEVGRQALHAAFGMVPVRTSVNFVRPIENGLPPVELPAGYTLRPFDPERDVEAAWQVDLAAFADHWGFTSFPLEEFRHWIEAPDFRADLSWLAQTDGGEPVGLAFNRVDPDWIARTGRVEGLVGTLGVLREHRHRGLGTALLIKSLHALRSAGMQMAHLWADSENLTGAVRIYERAGFQRRKTVISYRKAIREA